VVRETTAVQVPGKSLWGVRKGVRIKYRAIKTWSQSSPAGLAEKHLFLECSRGRGLNILYLG